MTKPDMTIAYLTIVDDERTGWTGGLLILNRGGRPLEFQCTLPVRPTKTHQILFGATLRHHLIAEVIAPTLVARSKTPIGVLACDQPETLALMDDKDIAVALVAEAAEAMEGPIADDTLAGESFTIGGATFMTTLDASDAWRTAAESLIDLPDGAEPFDRIRDAIREAHSQIARAASRNARSAGDSAASDSAGYSAGGLRPAAADSNGEAGSRRTAGYPPAIGDSGYRKAAA